MWIFLYPGTPKIFFEKSLEIVKKYLETVKKSLEKWKVRGKRETVRKYLEKWKVRKSGEMFGVRESEGE